MRLRDILLDAVQDHPEALIDLVGPSMLPLATRAWNAWADLSARRSVGQHVEPLKYTEIEAWGRVTGQRLTPMDLYFVLVADDVFVKVALDRLANREATTPTPENDE